MLNTKGHTMKNAIITNKNIVASACLAVATALFVCGTNLAGAAMMAIIPSQANNTDDGTSAGTVQNGGGGSTMLVKQSGYLPTDRKAYLLFNLSGDNADASAPATVTITQSSSGNSADTFGLYGLNAGYTTASESEQGSQPRLGTNWLASQIDGNNAPGNNSGSTALDSSWATEIATFTVAGAGVSETIAIPSLTPYLQSDGTMTLMVRQDVNNGDNGTGFYTNLESVTADRPTLTFAVAAVPEPTSIGLLVVGVTGLLFLRRRSMA